MKPQWIRDLEANAQANLFAVESSYTLTQGDASYPVTSVQLGFRINPSQVVTTAEAEMRRGSTMRSFWKRCNRARTNW